MLARPQETAATTVEAAAEQPQPAAIDPRAEAKLRVAREAILDRIRERRPRFVPTFERMRIEGNRIAVDVPSQELHDEIRRNQTALLLMVARLSGVEGVIELDVAINEEIRAARPIKLEDRVRYLSEKNPLLVELRQALDMEVE